MKLVLFTALLAILFLVTGRVTPAAALRAVDVDLLLVLFALLVAVEILRDSGWLNFLVVKTVTRFHTTRGFSIALIAFSGVLSMLVTNDVTLFVVIPFTVIASRFSDFDAEDTIILEIIAANLLGCLTPLGNPQNLFVFHRSGWSAAHFVVTMLPLVAVAAAGLLAATFILCRTSSLARPAAEQAAYRRPDKLESLSYINGILGVICFLLVLLEIAHLTNAWPAAIAAFVAGILVLNRRLLAIDLTIIPLFGSAFVVVEGLRSFSWTFRFGTYPTAIALSQVISNVPAAVLLSPFTSDWRTLLYGVNAGGCGTIIASLANLLGWRIYVRESGRDRRFFRRLTALNFAFLLWIGLGGWLLLRFT